MSGWVLTIYVEMTDKLIDAVHVLTSLQDVIWHSRGFRRRNVNKYFDNTDPIY